MLRSEVEVTKVGLFEDLDLSHRAWSTRPRQQPAERPPTVAEVMRSSFISVPQDMPIETVEQALDGDRSGFAFVVNEHEDLIGVIERADLDRLDTIQEDPILEELAEQFAGGIHIESHRTAADVMTTYVRVARPSLLAVEALALMEAEQLARLPVVIEGDGKAIGVVLRDDLRHVVRGGAMQPSRQELHGTFRNRVQLPRSQDQSRDSLVEKAEAIARSWLRISPVHAQHPDAITFTAAMRPVLTALSDALIDHYSDVQEGPLFSDLLLARPELAAAVSSLKDRQNSVLSHLATLRQELRFVRRPQRSLLRKISALMAEIRALEETETDLVCDAHYVDIPALD
jgi:CBS-domain-containing membrane protein